MHTAVEVLTQQYATRFVPAMDTSAATPARLSTSGNVLLVRTGAIVESHEIPTTIIRFLSAATDLYGGAIRSATDITRALSLRSIRDHVSARSSPASGIVTGNIIACANK